MKVLVITASLNQRSGWGRYGRAVIEELIRLGHEVRVLSEDSSGEPFEVARIEPLKSRMPLLILMSNMRHARSMAKDVDVVHSLDGWPYGVYGWAAVLGTHKRLVINGVGSYAVAPLYAWGSSWFLRRSYARASAIPCISNYTRDQVRAAGVEKDKVLTVHMGAPVLPNMTAQEMHDLSRAQGLDDVRHPIILTVGSIKERKGQLDTLRAIGILKQKYPNIMYLAVGSGNHKDYVRSMCVYADENDLSENFKVISDVDDRTLAALYASCTVFALNSNSDPGSHHFEGFGLVVLEAAGYGKPAVGSRDSGVEDTIDEGISGLLTLQHDPEDIARKIDMILADYQRFAMNATRWHGQFTWQKAVEGYIRHYTG